MKYALQNEELMLFDTPCEDSMPTQLTRMTRTFAYIVERGKVSCILNGERIAVTAPSTIVVVQGSEVCFEGASRNFQALTMVTTDRFGNDLHLDAEMCHQMYRSFREQPYMNVPRKELGTLVDYFSMLKATLQVPDNPYIVDTTLHLTMAFLYGIGYLLHKYSLKLVSAGYSPLVQQLLLLVKENYTTNRTTPFYAEKMQMTPRYLSRRIKVETGKSIAQWVDEFTLQKAYYLLLNTNKTISQVADELHFPSQSFFGKYFKRLTGMSPKKFRN